MRLMITTFENGGHISVYNMIGVMKLTIRLLRELDGRWIGDIPELAGATVYAATADEATTKVKALALRIIAEEIEHGEMKPEGDTLQFLMAA
jgi:predicted RNase H-like HicB family nuclease